MPPPVGVAHYREGGRRTGSSGISGKGHLLLNGHIVEFMDVGCAVLVKASFGHFFVLGDEVGDLIGRVDTRLGFRQFQNDDTDGQQGIIFFGRVCLWK